MVRTHIQVAQSQVEEARKLSEDADKKLAETKVEEIQRKAEYAALQDANDEYELHEAYLREDWDKQMEPSEKNKKTLCFLTSEALRCNMFAFKNYKREWKEMLFTIAWIII